jgi:SNF2 family DNA or RNA helicase
MPVTVELDEAGEHILIQAEHRYKELCKSIPGSNWNAKAGFWRLPVSWAGCLALRGTFGQDLQIGPKLTEWSTTEYQKRVHPSNYYRELPEFDKGDPDLYPHQRAGVAFLWSARRALLADEPGLGKTAQSIRALAAFAKNGENPFPVLVVCPNTLKKNWEREFNKWWPGVRVQVIHGTAVQRRKQFKSILEPEEGEPMPHVIVMNWESMRAHSRLAPYGSIALKRCTSHGGEDGKVTAAQCEVHERELNQIEFKAVIADEIHRSKDPKSKQTRALWAATGKADIRFALTGTPIAANVTDMWAILHWLSPEEWPTKSKWIDRYVDAVLNTFGGLQVLGLKPGMQEEFFGAVNPRMRRMLKKVVLPHLPPIINEQRTVEMSAKQKKAYIQMRDHMIAELEDGNYLTAPSPLVQTTRLLQFASAYAELSEDPNTGETKAILSEPSASVDALVDDLLSGDFGEDSIAISSVSRQLLELLSAKLTKHKIDHGMITGAISPDIRQKNIDDFQNGKIKVMLFTVQAGGVGVTLTKARWLLRLQRPWSLVDDIQANDRVHRIGSEIHDSIVIVDYVVEDTVQERIQEVLDQKSQNFEEIVKDREKLLKFLKDDKVGKKK